MLRYANGFLFLGRVEKRDCGGGVVCFLAMMARMDRFGNGYLWNFATGFLIYIFFSHVFLFKLVLKGSKIFLEYLYCRRNFSIFFFNHVAEIRVRCEIYANILFVKRLIFIYSVYLILRIDD